MELRPIAHIESPFPTKFGIPRQAGLAGELEATVVFEKDFAVREALRGIENFSHLWLIWEFSEFAGKEWSPTVRPPRLGGNRRLGVFATRSPLRPNPIGLSCVRLLRIGEDGISLVVAGADLMDGTPIVDIKPYIPYADCHPEAAEGYAARPEETLRVEFLCEVPEEKKEALRRILALDPRPQYQDDPDRIYGFGFDGAEIRFRVEKDVLKVTEIV